MLVPCGNFLKVETRLHGSTPIEWTLCKTLEEEIMDKDRVVGWAKQLKGAVKQVVGKAVGDTKLESEGKTDKIEGKVQNAIGGLKDTLKGK